VATKPIPPIDPEAALELPEISPTTPTPKTRRPRRDSAPVEKPQVPAPDGFRDLLGQAVGLRLDAVTRVYGMGQVKVHALQGVSLEIAPGEFVAVLGPSGCGKSTLLGLLGGLDRPTSGHVYAAGEALDQVGEQRLADYRLQRVGTVFQTFNLVAALPAEDNVALPLALAGVPTAERRERARRLLQLVGLDGRHRFSPSRLSGGEQQRTALARALANRPGVVLADEPTGNLDSAAGEKVLALLEDLNRRGATVVLVTHDPNIAKRAGRVIKMRDGRIVAARPGGRTPRAPLSLDPPTRLKSVDALWLGLRSIGRRPLRTSLTSAGVAIGIGVMSLILSLAAGLQGAAVQSPQVQDQLEQVQVTSGGPQRPLDTAAVAALARLPHVRAAWGQIVLEGTLTAPGASATSGPTSVLASLPPVRHPDRDAQLVSGRLPRSDEGSEVVLSMSEASRLGLSPRSALGHSVEFRGAFNGLAVGGAAAAAAQPPLDLKVVGVSRSSPIAGDFEGGSIPYGTALRYWSALATANGWKSDPFRGATLLADSTTSVSGVRDEARAAGYPAETLQAQVQGVQQLLDNMALALLGLAAIALVLAGLGIVNTMYTSVLERTREIGVMKALGARARDIRLIFIAEAAVIGATGGVAGVALAAAVGRFGNQVLSGVNHREGSALDLHLFQVTPWIAVAGFALAILLSLLSGLLPAIRAAIQDPASALRYE
jgi:macrolide transport system ATP-binding/permease protein